MRKVWTFTDSLAASSTTKVQKAQAREQAHLSGYRAAVSPLSLSEKPRPRCTPAPQPPLS